MVQGDKLLYGHVPDPFPWYGIVSGHTRLAWAEVCYHTAAEVCPHRQHIWMDRYLRY